MASDFKIFWTEEAIINLEDILDYLRHKWTKREINNFKLRLSRQIALIQNNPKLFPLSDYYPRLRKAVLSKHTTIFYEVKDFKIYLVYLFSNKQNIDKIK
ncbi:MAG: type II toxin-antitoxin system RelE/ParE family toxin [Bacteroidales bacterium]|nr:type II toxin-antitoxin system RelE/ParE family toxin [Bacteroidales bacterium]